MPCGISPSIARAFIKERVDHAGHAMHTIFVDDHDALVEQIAERGLEPAERETYSNGVRKSELPRSRRATRSALAVRRSRTEPTPSPGGRRPTRIGRC